jgi:pimeloyl-ACP methyl ester carboxylesterase
MVRSAWADDGGCLLSIDHFVGVRSTVPAISGQTTQIYVREVALSTTVTRGAARTDRVALFVHGAGVPGEVSFDVPFQDCSWMAYLARAGFDVFAMDFTGYGKSTRPNAMNDPCNLAPKQQASFAPGQLDPAVRDAVWSAMIEPDPVDVTWGTGIQRAPHVFPSTNWGWTQSAVAKTDIPTLMVTGELDKVVPSSKVRDLYADLGTQKKVIIELACSSHPAMWERNHLVLFRASLEWLVSGTVNGREQGALRLSN